MDNKEDKIISVKESRLRLLSKHLTELLVRAGRCCDQLTEADKEELNMTALAAESFHSLNTDIREVADTVDGILEGK